MDAVTHLRNVIAAVEDIDAFKKTARPVADQAMQMFMSQIEAWQPYSSPEPYYGATPSQRLGHTPIGDGWRADTEETGSGFRISIANVSEHVRFVIGGTQPHPIPFEAGPSCEAENHNLFFWWGTRGEYGKGKNWGPKKAGEGPPGLRKFLWVDHPGQEPNNFVERAAMNQKRLVAEVTQENVGLYLTDLMSNFGLRRINV